MAFVRLAVRLTPKGGADRVDGMGHDETGRPFLKARVRAAPEDGAANRALVQLMAKTLCVAPGRVQVVSGATQRLKLLAIDEMDAATLARALAPFGWLAQNG
jgi:uncharacterized protein YggU (UPF0235/DUF167 family)